jgi:spore germination cell wall hydrolase CwlJ-like protein
LYIFVFIYRTCTKEGRIHVNKKTKRILYSTLGSTFVFIAAFTAAKSSDVAATSKYMGTVSYKEYLKNINSVFNKRDMGKHEEVKLAIVGQEVVESYVPAPNPKETLPAPTPKPVPVPSVSKSVSSVKAAPKPVAKTASNTSTPTRGQAPKESSSSTVSKTVTIVSNGRTYSISEEERKLLTRLVHAEAEAESYAGKLAVATVVINRVISGTFPNTVTGVVMGKESGYYQFTPVLDGRINNPPGAEAVKAVDQVLGGYRSFSPKVMWFLNPRKATSGWIINNKTFYKSIGNHDFYY